ncbi:Protein 21.1 [Giardia lamblia P15]|uniref:Protein 21.1 n=1 Tax=Giardia intestinalis (strain P15) TaxID=658858 RepID=E1EZN7_GIAIA|nr:Protein 21.1 [Giardia lamblia P15]
MPPKKTTSTKDSLRAGSKPASSGQSNAKGALKGKGGARAPSKLQKTKKSGSVKNILDKDQLPPSETHIPKVFVPFEPPHPYRLIPDSTETYGLQGKHLCTHPSSNTPHVFISFCIQGLEEGPKRDLKQRYNNLKLFRHENLRAYEHFYDGFLTSIGAVSDYVAASYEDHKPKGHTLKEICDMYQSKGQLICESTLWDIAAQLFNLLAIMHSPLDLDVKSGARHSFDAGENHQPLPLPHGNLSVLTVMCDYSSRSDYELIVGPPLLSGYRNSKVSDGGSESLVLVTPEDDIRDAGLILHELATFSEAGNIPVTYSSNFQSFLRSLTSKDPTKPLPSASEILLLREIQGITYRRTAPSEQKLHELLSKTSLKVDTHTEPDIEQAIFPDAPISPDEDGNTPLHLAVQEANLNDLSKLKGYAGRRNKQGKTALMIAVEMDAVDAVRELAPLESNCFLLDGTTALSLALELEHLECAAILLKYEGIDNRVPNIDSNGVTNLMRAAENDDLVGVWSWLPRQCKYADNQGQTAFMRAAATGNLKLCKLLMQSEAGMRDINGRTALMHYAITGGSVSLDEYEAYHLAYPSTIDIPSDVSIMCSQSSTRSFPPPTENTFRSTTALSTSALSTSADLRRLKRSRFHQEASVNSELLQLLCSLEGNMTDKNGRNALYLAIAVNNMETALALVPYEGPEPVLVRESSSKDSQLRYSQDETVCIDAGAFHLCSSDKYPSGFTDLMDAVLENDVYRAFCFMRTQSKRFDSSGFSALMYAAYNNRPMLCRLLAIEEAKLQAYVHTNPNNFYSCNKTALMVAAEAGHIECVRILAPYEACVTDSEDKTALMYAASNGHEEVVMELIQREHGMNAGRFNAASYAIMNGHYKIANILLASEKDANDNYIRAAEQLQNTSDSSRTTPLMLAAKTGDIASVFSLKNQYLKLVDARGMTALLYACEFGCRHCVHLLKDEAHIYRKSDGLTPRALAEEHHLVDCYDDLPPIIVRDNRGNTQLHRAVLENNSTDLQRYCHLARELNSAGLTSLMLAAANNNIEAASLLVDREGGIVAKKYKVTNLFWTEVTAMMIAAALGHHEIVQKLAYKEAKMCEKTEGRTALMAAAALGRVDVVRVLSSHESHIQKHDGWSALMYAAAYGYGDCVEYLLDEVRLTANDGWTALMCAAKNGHSDIVRQLIEHEKGMLKNKKYPALYYAIVSGHIDCVKLLLPHEYSFCKVHIMNDIPARKGVSQETLAELSNLLRSQELSAMCNQNGPSQSEDIDRIITVDGLDILNTATSEK